MYQTLDNSINPASQSEKYSLMDPGTHNNMEPNYGSKGPYLPNLSNVEKFQQLQGIYDDTYAKPKTEVLNTNQYTWVPQAINNTIEYPRDNMYERALDTMYLRNNVKPFETELVGAADDPLLFRPLPKVGGELYVNPKSELKYTSIAPGGSAIENPTCSPNVAKNKVPTAFKNPAPNGFTTTGAVQGALTHGEINLGYQNRQDTNPEYTVPGNTMNARTSVVTGPLRDVRKKFTSKNDYTYAPNPAYGVASTMNKDSIHTMKTDLEKLQNTVGQRPYNNGINVPATTRTDLIHQMNTQLEQDQLNAGQNIVNSVINTPATMNNKQVYGMKTQLEKDQLQAGSRTANTGVEIPMTMRNKDNYLMKTRLEKDQLNVGSRTANTGVNVSSTIRNKDNYTMKTRLEQDQLRAGSRTANMSSNIPTTIRNKDNYTMKTQLEKDQLHVGSRPANTSSNVPTTMRNKDNYTMKTQLEKDQLKTGARQANTSSTIPERIRNFLAMTFDKVKETLSPEYYASGTGPTAQRSRSQFVTTGNKFETINPERMGGCNDSFNPNINVKCDRNNLQIRGTNPSASYDQSVVERVPMKYRFRDTDSVSISINNRLDPGITKPLVDNPYITTNLSIM